MPSQTQIDSFGGASPGSSTYIGSFSPVLGGYYYKGTLYSESTAGLWWGSTASNGARRYFLNYNGSSLYTTNSRRNDGFYIRCVSEEKDVSDLTYMQDMAAKVVTNPKGWTLPTTTQIDSIGGTSPGSNTYISSFSPVLGGYYINGALSQETTRGRWWGSMAYNGVIRYYLGYNSSNLYTGNDYGSYRGFSIRCIQAS